MKLGPNQKKFVQALRTTKFKQCRGRLFTDDDGKQTSAPEATHCCTVGLLESTFGARNWFGSTALTTEKACLLIDMNDEQKLSFAEIANKIEAAPQDFFTESK
jgi:hypothetical protein